MRYRYIIYYRKSSRDLNPKLSEMLYIIDFYVLAILKRLDADNFMQ